MSKHPLEQEVLEDNLLKLNLCISLCRLIDTNKFGAEFEDIRNVILRKASGYKLMVNFLENNTIIEHNK